MSARDRLLGVVCLVVGTLAWVVLVVVPGADGSTGDGGWFQPALGVAGLMIGLAPAGRSLVVGGLLGAPALLTAGWIAPRGDGDGLWVLWFPLIVWTMGVAAVAHWAGTAVRRRWGHRRQTHP